MGTAMYGCGCAVTRSMFGDCPVVAVHHCGEHLHLHSQDKTLRQMAGELAALMKEAASGPV